MPLVDLEVPFAQAAPPGDVRSFLREAERRIERFQRHSRIPAFVPSDFARTYAVLRTLAEADLAPGNLFCEWGSGFGVVTCLAAMLDFDACGIEIEAELVEAAQELAADFDLPVEFMHGSFVPQGGEAFLDNGDGFGWLTTEENEAQELDLEPEDFDVIFAYPWPDEEQVTGDLFERFGRAGAVLVTHHGCEDFRVRRKMSRRKNDRGNKKLKIEN